MFGRLKSIFSSKSTDSVGTQNLESEHNHSLEGVKVKNPALRVLKTISRSISYVLGTSNQRNNPPSIPPVEPNLSLGANNESVPQVINHEEIEDFVDVDEIDILEDSSLNENILDDTQGNLISDQSLDSVSESQSVNQVSVSRLSPRIRFRNVSDEILNEYESLDSDFEDYQFADDQFADDQFEDQNNVNTTLKDPELNDNDFTDNPFLRFFEAQGFLNFSDDEIIKYNQFLLAGETQGEVKFLTYQNSLDDIEINDSSLIEFNQAIINGEVLATKEFAKFLLDLQEIKLNPQDFQDACQALINGEVLATKEFAKTCLFLKNENPFSETDILALNQFLIKGSLHSDISNDLKERILEYLAFLKVNGRLDITDQEDDLLHEFAMEPIDNLPEDLNLKVLLRSNLSVYKSSKPSVSVSQNSDSAGETSSENNSEEIVKQNEEIAKQYLESFLDRINTSENSLENHQQESDLLEESPTDISLSLESLLNADYFSDIFTGEIEMVIDSEYRAVNKSTQKSFYEFNVWSKGKNNPNQDCAISFDEGMVLCDGAGAYDKSELASAYFANFFYTHRKLIAYAIKLIHNNRPSELKPFIQTLLSFISEKLKNVYPDLFANPSECPTTTLSLVLKLDPKNPYDKRFFTLTVGDSPIYQGDKVISGDKCFYDIFKSDYSFFQHVLFVKFRSYLRTLLSEFPSDSEFISSMHDCKKVDFWHKLTDPTNFKTFAKIYPRLCVLIGISDLSLESLVCEETFNNLAKADTYTQNLNRLKYLTRNIIMEALPNGIPEVEDLNARVVCFDANSEILICSDGLSDNLSEQGILEISHTPVEGVSDLNIEGESDLSPSFFKSLFHTFKPDDSTLVSMSLKNEFKVSVSLDEMLTDDVKQSPLESDQPKDQAELLSEFISINADESEEELIVSAQYASRIPKESYSETQEIKIPSRFAILKSKVGSWFKRSIPKSDATDKSIVTRKFSWFDKFKSRLLTFDYAQSLQKFLTYKTVAVFSIGILTYLLKDSELASQLFNSLDSIVSFDQTEPNDSDQNNLELGLGANLEGGNSGEEAFEVLQEGSNVSIAGDSLTAGNDSVAGSNAGIGSESAGGSNTSEVLDANQNVNTTIENTTNNVSTEISSVVSLKLDTLNESSENLSQQILQDSDSSLSEVPNQEDLSVNEYDFEIEGQMQVESQHFINVNCDISQDTLKENGVDSLNPENANINVNETYSVNLNDEDSSLLKRDDTGRVIGRLNEGENFKFTGSTQTVSANNATDEILYAEAKTSDGNTFWIARAYAKQV